MSLQNPTSQSPGVDMNKMVQVDSGHFEDRATSNEDFISPNPGSFSRIIQSAQNETKSGQKIYKHLNIDTTSIQK